MPARPKQHQDFIDWMKAVGMVLIVVGHVVGSPDALFNAVSEPVYSKQLGVAFFVFVAGWGLAHSRRPKWEEAYHRLFAIFLYGGACAVVLSVIYLFTKGDINESNYLPFIAGINVFFNYFPANPTTWYIGMYLHLILLWALFKPTNVRLLHVAVIAVAEVAVRAAIFDAGRNFTAYMLVTNWMTVFALGQYLSRFTDRHSLLNGLGLLAIWLIVLAAWYLLPLPVELNDGFPTQLPKAGGPAFILVSALVTAVYAGNTLFAFAVFRNFQSNVVVRFVARNTLLIFILHMPLIYGLVPVLYPLFDEVWMKKLSMALAVILIPGLINELVDRILPVSALRDWLWRQLRLVAPA